MFNLFATPLLGPFDNFWIHSKNWVHISNAH